jgi:ATP adenylyltransferase
MTEAGQEFQPGRNLWAPWRIEYVRSLDESDEGCFLCRARDDEVNDEENLVLWQTDRCLVVMNRFPYSSGHMLVCPVEHIATLDELTGETMREMMELVRDLQVLLRDVVRPHGFNAGINFGNCAGAGLPGHLHMHVVPRWSGDTNFMAVLGNVRVIPQSLRALYAELREGSARLGLPRVSP